MVVIVTGPAEADLEHIADYIAARNPVSRPDLRT